MTAYSNFSGPLAQLRQRWQAGRWPQNLVLAGIKGVGKRHLAWQMAVWILDGMHEDTLIGADTSQTAGLMRAGAHPDFLAIDEDPDKQSIPVDAVRALSRFARQTPALARHKVVMVDAMDAMNINAANAFLKIVEEPPADLYFLLICHQPGRLLPTIRSRVQIVRVPGLDRSVFDAWLATQAVECSPDLQEDIFAFAEGAPGLAQPLLHPEILTALQAIPGDVPVAVGARFAALRKKYPAAVPVIQAFIVWRMRQTARALAVAGKRVEAQAADDKARNAADLFAATQAIHLDYATAVQLALS